MADDTSAADRNVEIWKIKKLIKSLEAARGYDIFLCLRCHGNLRRPLAEGSSVLPVSRCENRPEPFVSSFTLNSMLD